MEERNLFIDFLPHDLVNEVDKHISLVLLHELYEDMNMDDPMTGDRRYACMSDSKEVRIAFNQFYNLSPEDAEYLD
jgi:hypothetical protein